jgi:hypothetical protein
VSEREVVSVALLWERLRVMELEKRFNGQSYPIGMCPFPFRLLGQGFFPGGDGLWRDDSKMAEGSDGLLAVNGLMFLGNDFGTIKSYERYRSIGFEDPTKTWKRIKDRVLRADLPTSITFFTNAVMGLRKGGTALEKRDWDREPRFTSFCREFLTFQIETLRPLLVVVMGPTPQKTLNSLEVAQVLSLDKFPRMRIGNHTTRAYFSTHPYGDFNFNEGRRIRNATELREAWNCALA